MKNFNVVQSWLDSVAYSHSKSGHTEKKYRWGLRLFCDFIEKTPAQIVEEYETAIDRLFRRKYAGYIRGFISHLVHEGYASGSVKVMVAIIQSFFKYSDLPLGHIPVARSKITFHNRDITKSEIVNILNICAPRERAFFCMMTQTGLRPHTICQLRIKHIQPDFKNSVIPCKVDVPVELAKGQYRAYFTFMGKESVNHLKNYFRTRPNIRPESYLFTQRGSDRKMDRRNVSHRFNEAVLKLKEKGLIEYKQKAKGKPGSVRLYNLRKFFRKYANQAGFEFVQFWMGHVVKEGQEEHYQHKDEEFHRQLYAEKAMPFLRLEMATPSETEQTIKQLEQKMEELRQENLELKQRLNGFTLSSDQVQELLRRIEKLEKQAQKQT